MVDWKKQIMRKDGKEARLVTDKNNEKDYPMGVLIKNPDGMEEYEEYTKEGKYNTWEENDLDIINVQEK